MSGLMNPSNPLSPLNPINQSIYYSTPPEQSSIVNDSHGENLSSVNQSIDINFSEVMELSRSMLETFYPILLVTIAIPLTFIVLTMVKNLFEVASGTHYSRPTKPKKEVKPKQQKPKEPVYRVPGGNGYYVKGYDGEETYVPLTDLYPEGTDMKELLDLKKYNVEDDKS